MNPKFLLKFPLSRLQLFSPPQCPLYHSNFSTIFAARALSRKLENFPWAHKNVRCAFLYCAQ